MTRSGDSSDSALAASTAPIARIAIATDALAFAVANANAHVPDETGGVIIGHGQGDTIFVTHLTGPGANAVHRPDWFVRDGVHAQAMLDGAVRESDGRDNYLGEWHSHPIPLGPSMQDRESMRRISRNADYDAPYPLLILCRSWRRGWRFEGYRWNGARLARIEIVEE